MRHVFVFVLISMLSVFLLGCVNHTRDYLKHGQEISSVVVPKEVPILKQSDYYPVPSVSASKTVKPVSLTPPTLQADH